MSIAVAAPADELQRLYYRYNALTLSASAALILEQDVADLERETDALLEECIRCAPVPDCVVAARALTELVHATAAGQPSAAQLEQVRVTHSRLRRAVWSVLPCEYVPCCASDHQHG